MLSHRNLLAGGRERGDYLGNTADDVILAALPSSFDAGLSQLTTTLTPAPTSCWSNYLLPTRPGPAVRPAPGHRARRGAPAVDPAAAQNWPAEATRHLRYFANTGGRMPRPTLTRLRELFPAGRALPDVRPDRGVPRHLPGPGRGRPPPGLDRQGHPQRRGAGGPARRHAVRPDEEGELVHAARWSRRATGCDPERDGGAVQPRARRQGAARTRSRCGPATSPAGTRRASSTSSGASTR